MIRLHHAPQSRSMRTLWLLHELGVEFDVVVYPFGPELQAETYRAVNPLGRVPSLELDGEVILESGAMAELLTERFAERGLGRMPGDAERAAWLQWIHFAETISVHIQILTQHHIVLFEDHMRSPTVMKLEARRILRSYDLVEAALDGRDTLLVGGFSAADVGVAQAVWLAQRFAATDNHPNVARWLAACEARPAFQASLPKPGEPLIYTQDFYPPWPTK